MCKCMNGIADVLLPLRLEWFGSARQDAAYLEHWRGAALSHQQGQPPAARARADRYRVLLGSDATGGLFARAAERLLRYQFYPDDVLVHTSDFTRQQRAAQPGDRVLQRIRVLYLTGLPVLDVLTMNEVSEVIDEPGRRGLSYVTTRRHGEVGEWSAVVEQADEGKVYLRIRSLAWPAPTMPLLTHPIMRALQLRAHQRGIQAFAAAVRPAQPQALNPEAADRAPESPAQADRSQTC